MRNNIDILPTCNDYALFLRKASIKFNISIDACRNLYGKYTYRQWNNLLNKQ